MTAPDPRWEEEARRWVQEHGHDYSLFGWTEKNWIASLTALLARVAEEARTEAMMLLHEASQAKLDLNDMLKNAHAAGRAEMREEAMAWLVGSCNWTAADARSLPTAKSAKEGK
jgi:hypothetical protein